MTVLDDLGVWLQSLLDAAKADGAASRQAEVDAAAAALSAAQAANAGSTVQIAQLTAQLAAVQSAYDVYVKAHPDAPPATPPALPVFEVSDFTAQKTAGWAWPKSMTTPGVYRMRPNTSTKLAPLKPTDLSLPKPTNPLKLVLAGSFNAGTVPKGLEYANFTLEGTPQTHGGDPGLDLYGGFMLGYSDGAYIHDVTITGIPGNDAGPPGETSPLELWHAINVHTDHVVLDGRRAADGVMVSATLLEHNYQASGVITHDNPVMRNAVYGFGAALFQTAGTHIFNNPRFDNCRKAMNLEQIIGGSRYEINGPVVTNNGAPYFMQISAINGSAEIVIRKTDAALLKVRTYNGPGMTKTAGTQLDSDIHCFDAAGNDVTGDKTKFQIIHTG